MYNPILTNIGKAKIADAIANNTTVNINTLAVGDSNGTRYSPTESQINLVNERYRTTIDSISIKPESPSLIEMIGVVPSNIGGFTIREVAVFDSDGDMIAISDHPDFEKFIISGSANSLELKFMIAVTNTDVVTLIVDDSAIYATREYVNNLDNGNVKTTGNQTIAGVKTFSSNPISTSTQSTAIDALTRKDYVDTKVAKVTSSDNSIVRFDGIDGYIQNSQVDIDDNGNIATDGMILSYNNYIASTDYTDINYIRILRQGEQGLGVSLEVVVQNTKTVEILPNGSYLSKSYGAIGYGSGAGGIVTQVGSKSVEVALNKPTGVIITHSETLTAGQSVTFPVYNAYFDSFNDTAYPIVVGSSNYRVESLILVSDTKYHIKLTNVSASSLSDSIEIRFVIFKGARA